MSPRRSAQEAAGTRAAIVDRAVAVAANDGLEGITIGRLAGELRMSKSGVIGHFGSKQALQLAALSEAIGVFRRDVWRRAAQEPPGLRRLEALCEAWIDYLTGFPGGCFLSAASCEFDARGGPVRDRVAETMAMWLGQLEEEAARAQAAGELPPDTSPDQVAFELNAIAMGLNQSVQLLGDPGGPERARRAMRRTLGLDG